MRRVSTRTVALICALFAGAALGIALASERWGGLAPCALCLLERWPYRVAIVLALGAVVAPRSIGRVLLVLATLAVAAEAALAFVHVGVEAHWWPSPLPECASPHITGASIAERLARMPRHPAKPCDAPSYLIPGLPLSLATMNFIFALAFAVVLGIFAWRIDRR